MLERSRVSLCPPTKANGHEQALSFTSTMESSVRFASRVSAIDPGLKNTMKGGGTWQCGRASCSCAEALEDRIAERSMIVRRMACLFLLRNGYPLPFNRLQVGVSGVPVLPTGLPLFLDTVSFPQAAGAAEGGDDVSNIAHTLGTVADPPCSYPIRSGSGTATPPRTNVSPTPAANVPTRVAATGGTPSPEKANSSS